MMSIELTHANRGRTDEQSQRNQTSLANKANLTFPFDDEKQSYTDIFCCLNKYLQI